LVSAFIGLARSLESDQMPIGNNIGADRQCEWPELEIKAASGEKYILLVVNKEFIVSSFESFSPDV
jgi:hypothetical protein